MRNIQFAIFIIAAFAALSHGNAALAAAAAAMPYDPIITTLQNSITTTIAGAMIVIGLLGAVAHAALGHGFSGGIFTTLIATFIGGAVLGFSGQILAQLGIAGAIV